jgi:hypothetical protein
LEADVPAQKTAALVYLTLTDSPVEPYFRKYHWNLFLKPLPTGRIDPKLLAFYKNGRRAIVAVMTLLKLAFEMDCFESPRAMLDTLECYHRHHKEAADPVASILVGIAERIRTGVFPKDTPFPTAGEVRKHLIEKQGHSPDIRTIYRRAKELGIKLHPAPRGAPPGKRKSLHRSAR